MKRKEEVLMNSVIGQKVGKKTREDWIKIVRGSLNENYDELYKEKQKCNIFQKRCSAKLDNVWERPESAILNQLKNREAQLQSQNKNKRKSEGKSYSFRFSDFKDQNNSNKYERMFHEQQKQHYYQMNNWHRCQNHSQRLAKFYVMSNEQHKNSKFHPYCVECTINLSKMNFKTYLFQNMPYCKQPIQQSLIQLLCYKNCLNLRSEELKNTQNFQLLENMINSVQEKYQHIKQLIDKIKSEQITALEKIKISIFQFIGEQEREVQGVKKKVQFMIDEFGKWLTLEAKNKEIELKQIYNSSIDRIKKEIDSVYKINPKFSITFPKDLSLDDITRKLEGMFSNTVHELSFDLESESEDHSFKQIKIQSKILDKIQSRQQQLHQYFYNTKVTSLAQSQKIEDTPKLKKKKLDFPLDINEQINIGIGINKTTENSENRNVINFNSTFGKFRQSQQSLHSCHVIQGIDYALSMSGSFCDQENVMINY